MIFPSSFSLITVREGGAGNDSCAFLCFMFPGRENLPIKPTKQINLNVRMFTQIYSL